MYKSGFLDLRTGHFFPNDGGGHPKNAQYIVQDNPHLLNRYQEQSKYRDYSDFLIYVANFAKIGNCGEKCIIINNSQFNRNKLDLIIQDNEELQDYEIVTWM